VFIAVLTDHCCSILVKCKRRAESDIAARTNGEVSARSFTYGDVAREAYGDVAYNLVDAALTFTQFGFCIQYFIFVCTTLRSFTPGTSLYLLSLVPLSFLIPCAFLPSVQSLSPVSGLANLAILCGFIGILSYDFSTGKDLFNLNGVPLCNWEQFPIFFSICMSCFEVIIY
jgi:amino acid permease